MHYEVVYFFWLCWVGTFPYTKFPLIGSILLPSVIYGNCILNHFNKSNLNEFHYWYDSQNLLMNPHDFFCLPSVWMCLETRGRIRHLSLLITIIFLIVIICLFVTFFHSIFHTILLINAMQTNHSPSFCLSTILAHLSHNFFDTFMSIHFGFWPTEIMKAVCVRTYVWR